MAVHIRKANFAQPAQLRFHVQWLVRWILFFAGDGAQKVCAESRSRRRDVLEVRENAARVEAREDFGAERAFAFVRNVVNGRTGDNGVELAPGQEVADRDCAGRW